MAGTQRTTIAAPVGLLAEVTHRCPMRCVYCSNPLEMAQRDAEMDTEQWLSVLDQAAELGVLQVHFSGGEPLQRRDLLSLIERANELELFTNLITSGVGITPAIVDALKKCDLGSFQLSIQGSDPETVESIGGGPFWRKKIEAAKLVRAAGISLSLNAVLHRQNLHQAGALIDLADSLDADRIELANTQYYGWALLNRDHLMPTPDQVEQARLEVEGRRERYGDAMEIVWVIPDYHADFPKPCMGGWGGSLMGIAPDGKVLPCLAAHVIPDLELPSVRTDSLRWIWYDSPAFNAFRGFDWMSEPCRSCPMRTRDFGGCRCQAYLLTGDATATDPVCIYSPQHHVVVDARSSARAEPAQRLYRTLEGPEQAGRSRPSSRGSWE